MASNLVKHQKGLEVDEDNIKIDFTGAVLHGVDWILLSSQGGLCFLELVS
jgi:hypothetical protein